MNDVKAQGVRERVFDEFIHPCISREEYDDFRHRIMTVPVKDRTVREISVSLAVNTSERHMKNAEMDICKLQDYGCTSF